jgi:hypothetical protein
MAEPGRTLPGLEAPADDRLGRVVHARTLALQLEALRSRNRMHASTSAPWWVPKLSTPAATVFRSGAPVLATVRAASVEGGVAPWSTDDTSSASRIFPIDAVGNSPTSSR